MVIKWTKVSEPRCVWFAKRERFFMTGVVHALLEAITKRASIAWGFMSACYTISLSISDILISQRTPFLYLSKRFHVDLKEPLSHRSLNWWPSGLLEALILPTIIKAHFCVGFRIALLLHWTNGAITGSVLQNHLVVCWEKRTRPACTSISVLICSLTDKNCTSDAYMGASSNLLGATGFSSLSV